MADINVTKWSLYYTSIIVNGSALPFVVCKFDTETPLTPGRRYTCTFSEYELLANSIIYYCKGKPLTCSVAFTDTVYSSVYANRLKPLLRVGDANGYNITQKVDTGRTKSTDLLLYYREDVVYNKGAFYPDYNTVSIAPMMVYGPTNTIFMPFDDSVSDLSIFSEPRKYPEGVYPFGVGFNSLGVPVCTTGDFGNWDYSVSPHTALWGIVTSIPAPNALFPFDPLNPYDPVDPSGPTNPDVDPPGSFDDKSDPIPDSSLPTLSIADTGFTRIYNPSLSQVQELARYLWTDEGLLQTLWNKVKQYYEDPMDAFIGFNLVPVKVPNGPVEEFKVLFLPTGVNLTTAANQFVDVDCGTCKLERYYGSALDQSPYTKVSAFLPYIGMVDLDTDEVMNSTLQVKYRVDIVSGSCVAKILVEENVLYQYSGHCAINIPFASADFSRFISAIISAAGMGIGAAAGAAIGGGAGAAAGASLGSHAGESQQTNKVVKTTQTVTDTERNPATGRQITSGTHTTTKVVETNVDTSSTEASFNGLQASSIANTVGEVMGSKPLINHSGTFSGNSGYMGIRRPYLIIERPNACIPNNYQHYNGYPCMITLNLGSCSGYTRVQQVQLTGLTATNPEQAEILVLLKGGVIF